MLPPLPRVREWRARGQVVSPCSMCKLPTSRDDGLCSPCRMGSVASEHVPRPSDAPAKTDAELAAWWLDQSIEEEAIWRVDAAKARPALARLLESVRREERSACWLIAAKECEYWRERGCDGQFASENTMGNIERRGEVDQVKVAPDSLNSEPPNERNLSERVTSEATPDSRPETWVTNFEGDPRNPRSETAPIAAIEVGDFVIGDWCGATPAVVTEIKDGYARIVHCEGDANAPLGRFTRLVREERGRPTAIVQADPLLAEVVSAATALREAEHKPTRAMHAAFIRLYNALDALPTLEARRERDRSPANEAKDPTPEEREFARQIGAHKNCLLHGTYDFFATTCPRCKAEGRR
jgi:hypothetical protein